MVVYKLGVGGYIMRWSEYYQDWVIEEDSEDIYKITYSTNTEEIENGS